MIRKVLVSTLIVLIALVLEMQNVAFPANPALQKIESDDPMILQEGTWINQPAPSASGGGYLYNSGEAALELQFSGPAVEILYVAGPSLGTLAIEVDGNVLRTVITTAPEVRYQQSAKINYLTDEPHTLRVYAQAGGVIGVDAFKVSQLAPYQNPADLARSGPRAPCYELDRTHRLSVASGGAEGIGGEVLDVKASYYSNEIAFVSTMTNLVAGDTNGVTDVFLSFHVSGSCRTERISVAADGTQANGPSATPYLSTFGASAFFSSSASNLVPNDTNGVADIFIWRGIGLPLTRIPFAPDGSEANGPSSHPWVGGVAPYVNTSYPYIVFQSAASNLVPNDTNGVTDIFLWTQATGLVTRVSVAADGTQANGSSYQPSISGDPNLQGRYIAFTSEASNLVPDDTNGVSDIFLVDRQLGTVRRLSVTTDGRQADGPSRNASMAYLAGIVAWESDATNMIVGTTIQHTQVYSAWPTTLPSLLSTNPQGLPGNGPSSLPTLSGGAAFTAYVSEASDLVADDTNAAPDVFVWDWRGGITRVSVTHAVQQSNGASPVAFISSGTSYSPIVFVFYLSDATNLIASDTNNARDLFAVGFPLLLPPPPPPVGDRLVLFNLNAASLTFYHTILDYPASTDYTAYSLSSIPTPNAWVLGDWDGDGEQTPAAFYDGAVAYTNTNNFGPINTWTWLWLGPSGPPIAGRLDATVNHDCIGAIDTADFSPVGDGFALYFTCDLTSGPTPTLTAQWLGALLPNGDGFSGTHYFAAGDFDGDGVDTMAVRREFYHTWTNTPPTTLISEVNHSQYHAAFGVFLTGDWNNDGVDDWGQVDAGIFQYWVGTEWYTPPSGLRGVQYLTLPPSTSLLNAASWRPPEN